MRCLIILMVAAATLSSCKRANFEAVSYRCGDLTVSAVFRDRDRAELAIGDRKRELVLVPAASGAKYADGAGNVLWTKGLDAATLTLAAAAPRSCTAHVD